MRVLFDIVHPAQVHFFKNVIKLLQARGDEVMVTSRKKDIALDLLCALDIEHTCISEKASNLATMAMELIIRDIRLIKLVRKFRPDVMVARVGHSVGPVGKLLSVPTIVYDDMEQAKLQAVIGMTFATYICTGLGYYRDFGTRQVRFCGSPVLSYLAPDYFKPDPQPLRQSGLDPDAPYILIRTVAWGASHDIGRTGATEISLQEAIQRLRQFGRVIISSEGPVPESLSQYACPVDVEQMHNLLSFASLCLVEGGTMAAESAVLGVPAICLGTYDFGYLRSLENDHGLIYRPSNLNESLNIAEELLSIPDLKGQWRNKQQKMLEESDDVVEFQLKMIERAVKEYPQKKHK